MRIKRLFFGVVGLGIALLIAACAAPPAPPTGAKSSPTVTEPTAAPAPTTFSDPFAYCASVGTIDAPDARYTGAAVPELVLTALKQKVGLDASAPNDWVIAGTLWRCMGGKVLACFVGANLPCAEKADLSRTPSDAMTTFCKENPTSDSIPAVAAGRATVFEWRCKDGTPDIVSQLIDPDAQGFLPDIWYELSASGSS